MRPAPRCQLRSRFEQTFRGPPGPTRDRLEVFKPCDRRTDVFEVEDRHAVGQPERIGTVAAIVHLAILDLERQRGAVLEELDLVESLSVAGRQLVTARSAAEV